MNHVQLTTVFKVNKIENRKTGCITATKLIRLSPLSIVWSFQVKTVNKYALDIIYFRRESAKPHGVTEEMAQSSPGVPKVMVHIFNQKEMSTGSTNQSGFTQTMTFWKITTHLQIKMVVQNDNRASFIPPAPCLLIHENAVTFQYRNVSLWFQSSVWKTILQLYYVVHPNNGPFASQTWLTKAQSGEVPHAPASSPRPHSIRSNH